MKPNEKKSNYIMGCICTGIIIGSILSLVFNNLYLLTIFTGVGAGIGLMYIWLKCKR